MDNLGIDLLFNPKKKKRKINETKNKTNDIDRFLLEISELKDENIIKKIIEYDINIDINEGNIISKDLILSLIKFKKLHKKKSQQKKKKINIEPVIKNEIEIKNVNIGKDNKSSMEKYININKIN